VLEAESEQSGEADSGRREVELGDAAAEAVEQDRDVLVLVGVDADEDIVGPKLHAGHG
jgi:hypothetical protein